MIEIESYKKEGLKTFVFDISDATVIMEFYIMNIGSSENQKIKLLDITISKGVKEIRSKNIHIMNKILDAELINAANVFWDRAINGNDVYQTEQSFRILPNVHFGIFVESESYYCYLYEELKGGWNKKRIDAIQDDDKSFIKVSCENGVMFEQLECIAPIIDNYVSSLLNQETTI